MKLIGVSFLGLFAFAGFAADITINVPEGVTQDFYTAAAANGLSKSSFTGQRLVKTGLGTLVSTNDLANKNDKFFQRLLVKGGVFVVRTENDFGYNLMAGDAITVEPGASIRFETSTTTMVNNRCILFSGGGAAGEGGALKFTCPATVSFAQYKLQGNATFATSYAAGYTACLRGGGYSGSNKTLVNLGGYDLTLKAVDGGLGYRLGDGAFRLDGSGRVIVDGTYFGQESSAIQNITQTDGTTTLVLKNGATFRPRTQSMVSFFDAIDVSPDSFVWGGEDGAGDFGMTIGGWIGSGTIKGGISSLTITDSVTARIADLNVGKCLSLSGPIVFSEGTELYIDGGISLLNPGTEGRVHLVTSETGIEGLPTLKSQLNRHWTFEKSEDGLSLDLVYDAQVPPGAIDVCAAWGLQPGADPTVDNAALFNAGLAGCETANPVLYFPQGDYLFTSALAVGAKGNVTIVGDAPNAVLRAGTGVNSLVTANGAANLTVTGLHFADATGPAVEAASAANLAVTNNYFTNVGGTVGGVTAAAPVAVTDSDGVLVRDNQVMGGKTYAAAVNLANSTAAAGGEPVNGRVRIWVDQGETLDFVTAFARTGRAAYPQDYQLLKVGPGTLIGTNKTFNSLIWGIEVQEGVFRVRTNDDCGRVKYTEKSSYGYSDQLKIDAGATVVFTGGSSCLNNRVVEVAGAGAPGEGGAIVIRGNTGNCTFAQYTLSDDAVFYTEYAGGYAQCFDRLDAAHPSRIRFAGHRLTLRAASGCKGFRLQSGLTVGANGGTLEVDGCDLGQDNSAVVPTFETPVRLIDLVLRNGAVFRPKTQDVVGIFDTIDCDATSQVAGDGTAAFDMTIGAWFGCGSVDGGIASLTVQRAMASYVSDLVAGRFLSTAGGLVIGSGASLILSGDIAALTAGTDRKVAESGVSLSGCPSLAPTKQNRHWSVVSDETSFSLAYDSLKPEGAVDVVADWGLVGDGETDNAALFGQKLAALTAADPVLYFPAGTYLFATPISVGAKAGVTLLGDQGEAVLKAGTDVASVVDASGSTGLMLRDLAFAGTTGPAVTATGANGLVVERNLYTGVGGAIEGVEGAYPVAAFNCTATQVRDNRVTDGRTFDAAVYLSGGTKTDESEPLADQVRLYVARGETETVGQALAKSGRSEYPLKARLVKSGEGTLTGQSDYSGKILGVTVEGGVYRTTADSNYGIQDFGTKNVVYVKTGGTLNMAGTDVNLQNRVVYLEGSGAEGQGGALVVSAGYCRYAQFRLSGDATIATDCSTDTKLLNYLKDNSYHHAELSLKGYTLTLTAVRSGKGIVFCHGLTLPSDGTIVADGVTLKQDAAEFVPVGASAGKLPLVLKNGASFEPQSQDLVAAFARIACDETSQVIGVGAAAFALTIGGWSGVGTVGTGFTSLTVTDSLAFAAADILAGKAMTAACPVTIASGVKMFLSDPEGLFAALPRVSERYVCAESAVSFTGLPRKDRTSDFRSWKPVLADGTKLCIDTYLGTLLLVR